MKGPLALLLRPTKTIPTLKKPKELTQHATREKKVMYQIQTELLHSLLLMESYPRDA